MLVVHEGVSAAENAAPPKREKNVAYWVSLLGSDLFAEREEASLMLSGYGKAAEVALKEALKSPDNEVKRRAENALAALNPVNALGEFVCISSQSTSADGQDFTSRNDEGISTLTVSLESVHLYQEYSNMKIDQTYTYSQPAKLNRPSRFTLALNWDRISQMEGYFPDCNNPRITCSQTKDGVRIIFEATDTRGTHLKKIFIPKAEAEEKSISAPDKN